MAEGPTERRFVRFELEGAVVWVACYLHPMAGSCLQPELAVESADRLEPAKALEAGMPVLEYVDLRLERDGHWQRAGHKADRPKDSCEVDRYVGPRGMTGLHGRYPDDVWMTVDRSGEEPVMSSVTSVYRFGGKEWKLASTGKKLGQRITRMFRWQGGMLGLVEDQGSAARFDAFGARAGAVRPTVPKNARIDELLSSIDGTVVAVGGLDSIELTGWRPGSAQSRTIALRAWLSPERDSDPKGRIALTPAGEVELFGYGELPIEAKPQGTSRMDKLYAKLGLARGGWKVLEQKPADWQGPASAEPAAIKALTADKRFALGTNLYPLFPNEGYLATKDGTLWAVGELEQDGKRRALLLRNKPVSARWRTSEAEQKLPEKKLIPGCTPEPGGSF